MSIFEVKPSKSTVTNQHPLSEDFSNFSPLMFSSPSSTFRTGPITERYFLESSQAYGDESSPSNFRNSLNTSGSVIDSASSSIEMQDMTDNLFTTYQPSMFDSISRVPFPPNNYKTATDIDNVNFEYRSGISTTPRNLPVSLSSEKANLDEKSIEYGKFQSLMSDEPPAYSSSNDFVPEVTEVTAEATEAAGSTLSALDLAPGIIGSSIINETTNAANQQRIQSAQFNPNFDARLYASMQNSQQSEIAGIGSTATLVASGVGATIGSALGPLGSIAGSVAGAAIGAGATAIAQHYSTVDPNIINTTGGGLTSADDAA